MSTIQENLEKILHAVFGRDVRQAIHDGIKNCYDDGIAGSEELNDVRNGYDGTSYPTAGEAVRSQFNSFNSKLSEEKTQRETADINLQNAINTESNARSTADTTLQENIGKEITARETAENAINESLESHDTRLNNLEHYTIKVDSEGYIAVEYKD